MADLRADRRLRSPARSAARIVSRCAAALLPAFSGTRAVRDAAAAGARARVAPAPVQPRAHHDLRRAGRARRRRRRRRVVGRRLAAAAARALRRRQPVPAGARVRRSCRRRERHRRRCSASGAALFALVLPAVRPLRARGDAPARFALGMIWGLVPCGLVYGVLPIALFAGGALAGRAGDAGVRHRHAAQSSRRGLDRRARAFVARFARRAIRGGVAARGVCRWSASGARCSARSRRCTARSASDAIAASRPPARPLTIGGDDGFHRPCRPASVSRCARGCSRRCTAPCAGRRIAGGRVASTRRCARQRDCEAFWQRRLRCRRCGARRAVRQCAVGRGGAASVAAARCGVGEPVAATRHAGLSLSLVRAADRHRDRRRERGDGRRASGRAE